MAIFTRLRRFAAIPAHSRAHKRSQDGRPLSTVEEEQNQQTTAQWVPVPQAFIRNHSAEHQDGEIYSFRRHQVISFLKTTLPADFNNSRNLEWRYVIRKGIVWKIGEAPDDYQPQSRDEEEVLALLKYEECNCD